MKSTLSAAAVVLGVLLLIASAVWGVLFPATRTWTEEKSKQLSELGSTTNRLKFELIDAQQNPRMHGGKNAAQLQQEFDAAMAEYNALYEEFKRAKDSPQTSARFLRWAGIAFVVGGAVVVFANRE